MRDKIEENNELELQLVALTVRHEPVTYSKKQEA